MRPCSRPLVSLLLVVGCSPAMSDSAAVLDPYLGEPSLSVVVGGMVDGVFTPWDDDAVVPWVWGSQGGVMVTPTLAVPASLAADGSFLQVEIRNRVDPDYPEDAGEVEDFSEHVEPFQFLESDGVLRATGVPNQIGWESPAGVRLLLDVTVRGEDFAARTVLSVLVDPGGAVNSCDELPTEGTECIYRLLPGTGYVEWVSPSTDIGTCVDPTRVEFVWDASDFELQHCSPSDYATITMPDGQGLPAACLDAVGLSGYPSIPVVQKTLVEGADHCRPLVWDIDIDLTPCEAFCEIPR